MRSNCPGTAWRRRTPCPCGASLPPSGKPPSAAKCASRHAFCVRVGASAKPFVHAQNWLRGFYEAYAEAHDLHYRPSLTNQPAVVLYERANHPGLFPTRPVFHRALADLALHKALVTVGEEVGYGLVKRLSFDKQTVAVTPTEGEGECRSESAPQERGILGTGVDSSRRRSAQPRIAGFAAP